LRYDLSFFGRKAFVGGDWQDVRMVDDERPVGNRDAEKAAQVVRPARVVPNRMVTPKLELPTGTSSLELLDRADRF
jgi:hypothetical protein